MTPLTKGGRWLKSFGQLSSFGSSMTEQSGYRLLKRSTAKGHMPAGGRVRPSALKEVLGVSCQNRRCSTVELIILSMSQNVLVGPLSCMGLSGPVVLLFLHMWCILLGLTLPLLQPFWPQYSTEPDGS